MSNGFSPNVTANGSVPGPRPIEGRNEYSDDLPSVNLAYQITDDIMVRAGWAKVMARPQLGNLSPSITALTAGRMIGYWSLRIQHPYRIQPSCAPGRQGTGQQGNRGKAEKHRSYDERV